MEIEFEREIKEKFEEYLKELKEDWTDRLVIKKEGKCMLCGRDKAELTEHHLIPRRVFEKLHPTLANFLESSKVTVCKECHGFFHPENRWTDLILKTEEFYANKAREYDIKKNEEVMKKDAEVSKYKQDYNNLETKLSRITTECDSLRSRIKELKDEINEIKGEKENLEKIDDELKIELNNIKSENFELQQLISIFGNIILFNEDKKSYKKKLKETIIREIDDFFKTVAGKHDREAFPKFLRKFENNIPLCELDDNEIINNKIIELTDISRKMMKEVFDEQSKTQNS